MVLESQKHIDPHAAHLAENETITGEWSFGMHPLGLDHGQIANKGTNTHTTIDSHIANGAMHFLEGSINHSAINEREWSLAGHTIDTNVSFGNNNIANVGNISLGSVSSDNGVDIVVNETGLDVDFRIETNGRPNAFFLQGSSGRVGLGTSMPTDLIAVVGDLQGQGITLDSSSGAGIVMDKGGEGNNAVFTYKTGGVSMWNLGLVGTNNFTVRELTGFNNVITVKSGSPANMLYLNNTGLIGVNETSPDAMVEIVSNSITEECLHLRGAVSQSASLFLLTDYSDQIYLDSGNGLTGSEFVGNEQGVDIDFRWETIAISNAFVINAGAEQVQFGVPLSLTGAARVKKTKVVSPSTVALGPNAPGQAEVGNFEVLQFSGTGVIAEEIFFEGHVPGDWASGTDITIHIEWAPTDGNAGNVVWQMDWVALQAENNEVLTAGTTSTSITDATQTLQDELLETGDMTISGGILALDNVVGIRIYRDPAHISDTYAGDASLVLIHFEYIADKLGKAT